MREVMKVRKLWMKTHMEEDEEGYLIEKSHRREENNKTGKLRGK